MSFRLAQPWVLWGFLLLLPYALLRARLLRRDAVPWAPLQLRSPLAPVHPGRRRRRLARLRLPVEVALLAVVLVALAGPHRAGRLELMEEEGIDVLLVLDVSLSMLAEDFPPNRMEALRGIAREFLERAGGHRVGIVIFGKDAYVQSPLTTDRGALAALLDSVTVHTISQAKSGGTAIGDALLVAADQLARARREGRDQALVLITDGESNLGAEPELAARYVRHLGIRLHAIGLGGEERVEVFFEGERLGGEGAPYLTRLDEAQLRRVAAAAEGRYYRAADAGALEEIFAHLSRLESAPLEVRRVEIRRFFRAGLALAALPLFALYLAFGGLLLRRPLR